MARIGGNTTALIERASTEKNEIGEDVQTWVQVGALTGWLDLIGNSGVNYATYNAPIAESTHVFLADYNAAISSVMPETCRATINGQCYDVQMIDDPMGMHRQLEIYLKYTGGQ